MPLITKIKKPDTEGKLITLGEFKKLRELYKKHIRGCGGIFLKAFNNALKKQER